MSISTEYVAGLFDGEGCITTSPRNGGRRLRVAICMKNGVQSFSEIKEKYGGSTWTSKYGYDHWAAHSQVAKRFLEDLVPHLRVKQEQARLGIELQEGIRHNGGMPISQAETERREFLSDEIKSRNMNKGGWKTK